MSDIGAFIGLGFSHIVSLDAMDHLLFLLALAAIYRLRDWRRAIAVVTAFTIGHSLTLALVVLSDVTLPTALVEFLIPVTIVATCVENLLYQRRATTRDARYRPVLAGVFGLVHGAGFASYLRSLFMEQIAAPLLGFNVGIEIGQILVLTAATVALVALDRLITVAATRWRSRSDPLVAGQVLRLRVAGVSLVVGVMAARWAVLRLP